MRIPPLTVVSISPIVADNERVEAAAKALARDTLTNKGRDEFTNKMWQEEFSEDERQQFRTVVKIVFVADEIYKKSHFDKGYPLDRGYPMIVSKLDDDDGYVAVVLDLDGCMGDGDTPAAAIDDAHKAIEEWIDEMKRLGREIPEPNPLSKDDYEI